MAQCAEDAENKPIAQGSGASQLPKEALVDLAKILVGQMEKGEADYYRMAAGVIALKEHGIKASLFERQVVFDPERHTRPNALYGMRLKNIGHVFGGTPDRDWSGLAETAREQMGENGDYLEMSKSCRHRISEATVLSLNEGRDDIQAMIRQQIEWARAQVSAFTLQHDVEQAPSSRRGTPRL